MSTELQYSIRVLIIHPTLASDEISAALNLKPRTVKSVGQPRRGPKGDPLGGVWPDTRWSVSEIRNGERDFFTRLDQLLQRFSKHRDFLRKVAETGGETNFIIGLCGEENIGDVLSEQTIARLADLKGSLGVEVFPLMNPRAEEHIWPDNLWSYHEAVVVLEVIDELHVRSNPPGAQDSQPDKRGAAVRWLPRVDLLGQRRSR